VLSTGGMDCWGDNTYGQLGNGTTGGRYGPGGGYDTPQAVTGITDAISVSSEGSGGGGTGFCAVLSTGGMDCWGDNTYGPVGQRDTGGSDGLGGYDTPQTVVGVSKRCLRNQRRLPRRWFWS